MKNIRNEKGQSLVEFTIILPLLLLMIMGILQFGMMLNSYLAVENASREGVRLGIIGASDSEIKDLIISTSPSLNETDLNVNIEPAFSSRTTGSTLVVKVNYRYELNVPIISNIFGKVIDLESQTSMRIE